MLYNSWVKSWLYVGLIMVFFQIVIGGVTRLTGSGLSITKWDIVTGTIPPITEKSWDKEFDLYKVTPQYEKINEGMTMSEFKWIYFWEYFHRLWARSMGFVFLFGFIFFIIKKWIDKDLILKLSWVIVFAMMAATFGWIMVASGLTERPWVNAYKLALHLGIALLVYAALFNTVLWAHFRREKLPVSSSFRKRTKMLLILLGTQLFVGGIMSGMKAGLFYPTWPDMNGEFFPQVVFNINEWTVENFNNYDQNSMVPGLVQLVHRILAYLLIISGLYYIYSAKKEQIKGQLSKGINMFITLLIIQVLLGILTVINCKGSIPIFLGVMHQAVAVLLLTSLLFVYIRQIGVIEKS